MRREEASGAAPARREPRDPAHDATDQEDQRKVLQCREEKSHFWHGNCAARPPAGPARRRDRRPSSRLLAAVAERSRIDQEPVGRGTRRAPPSPAGTTMRQIAATKSVAGVVFRTLVTRAVQLCCSLVTGLLIARILQPEGRGIFAVITTVAGAAIVVGHLSLEKSQIALWSDRSRHRSLTTNGAVLGLAAGSVSALGAILLVPVVGWPGERWLWALALFAVPFGAAAINLNGILMLQSQMDRLNRNYLCCALVLCLPVAALAAVGHVTLTNVVICWAASTALPFVLAVRILRPISLRCAGDLVRRQLSLSSRYHVGWVAMYLMVTTVDVVLLNAMDSPATVGIYTVAVTVIALARIPGETINQVVLPEQAASEVNDAKHITARALRLNLLVSAALVVGLVCVSPWLVPLVYGESFAGSVAPLMALAPGMIALMMVRPLEQHLVRLDRPTTMTVVSITALIANVLLNLVMIPQWGAVGAALASTATYILMAALQSSRFIKSTGLPARELIPGSADLRLLLRPLTAKLRGGMKIP
ncbi:lipopolysaccharide biosynthesis protein [Nonomuraea sp. NPDC049400]|uniref:lipopolysaccharide biosynthesis protein n=1 Tax=Nonomuraea sp. NPDC049400 TaxID=3364352 RepID=UPI0037984073